MVNTRQIVSVPRSIIVPHPKNTLIYGSEDYTELVEKIRETKWVDTFLLSNRGFKETGIYTILSGHSRNMACDVLGIDVVDAEIVHCETEEDELYWLLLKNQYRTKTNFQKAKEAEYWQLIEKKRAKKRMGAGSANLHEQEKGRTDEFVSEKVGMKARTLADARFVVGEIEGLQKEGRKEDAKILKAILNKSVSGAKKIIRSNFLDVASDELKDKLVRGDITTVEAIEIASSDYSLTDDLLQRLYQQHIHKAAEQVQKPEIRFVYELFKLQFPEWLWTTNTADKVAAVRYLIRHPKGQNLYRAYFYSNSRRELLFDNGLEAQEVYELCRMFRIPGPYENKESAASKLAERLRSEKYGTQNTDKQSA